MSWQEDTPSGRLFQLCVDNHVLKTYPQHMVEELRSAAHSSTEHVRSHSTFGRSVSAAPALIRRQWKAAAVSAILVVGASWALGSSINTSTARASSPRGNSVATP